MRQDAARRCELIGCVGAVLILRQKRRSLRLSVLDIFGVVFDTVSVKTLNVLYRDDSGSCES